LLIGLELPLNICGKDANIQEPAKMSNPRAENSLSAGDFAGQTQLCYAWEISRFTFRDEAIITLKQCQELVKDVWKGLNMRGHAPKVVNGQGSYYARNLHTEIHLPKWSRNNIIVLHELAHTLTNMIDETDSGDHGGIFVHVMITLLTRFADYKYGELSASAQAFGLKVTKIKLATKLKSFIHHEVKNDQ
jgi:hypothetical protein